MKLLKSPELVFDVKCKIRRKLNDRLDKAFKGMEPTCFKWCASYGFDYFFFSSSGPDDYFQAYYYGRHEDKAEILGEELSYMD